MKFSQIKALKTFTLNLVSEPCFKDVIEHAIHKDSDDFEIGTVRFIRASCIDDILAEELTNDLYILGCFNADFIADQLNWPTELVKAAQGGEAYEALGQAIKDNANMVEFGQAYTSADGYGHHFNVYDFGVEEIKIGGDDFYVFDNQ